MFRRYFFYLLLATGVCWLSWKLGDWKIQEPAVAARSSAAPRYSSFNQEVNTFLSETRRFYNTRDFDALEKQAQAIRSEHLTFSDGSPKIMRFYAALTCRNDEPESMWQLHDEIHRKWIASRPASFTAKTAYADFLVSYAALARGFNPENAMSRVMAEAFRARLAAAKQVLEQARELPDRDPVWWMVSLQVGQGQVWPAPVMRAFLEEAHRSEPAFWELDVQHARMLMSKQYGKPGEWELLAQEVARRPNGSGAEGYSRVVFGVMRAYQNIFTQSKASWELARDGLTEMLRRHPDSLEIIRKGAELANLADQPVFAKEMFSRLGLEYLSRDSVEELIVAFKKGVSQAFERRQFEELDKIAASLRTSKDRFADGSWKIVRFYEALDLPEDEKSEQRWNARVDVYKQWADARPQSVTARVGYARFLTKYAWQARGTGYADTVSEAQWRLFYERLSAARRVLDGTRSLPEKDPCAWTAAFTVALGQGWQKSDYDALVDAAHQFEPTFWYYDLARAQSLLPRWHGKSGDSEAYTARVCVRNDGFGDELYARVVLGLSGYYRNVFEESQMSWARTKAGLLVLTKKYPDSLHTLSQAIELGRLAKDRPFTKELFQRLGPRYVASAWTGPDSLLEAYQWANASGQDAAF